MSSNLPPTLFERLRRLYDRGVLKARPKCCGLCAFSPGSPERCDAYTWAEMAEAWANGAVFLCHEGIPDHYQQVEGQPVRVCAGWKAMEGKPLGKYLELAYCDGREPDPKFNQGKGVK